jgi:chromosome segregation ATPase
MMHDMDDDRFQRLEEALAFAERHVEDLDTELRKLFDRQAALEREIHSLRQQLRERELAAGSSEAAGEADGDVGESPPEPAPLERSDDEIRRDLPPHWGGGRSE